MAVYNWTTAISGHWSNGALWSPEAQPPDSATDDAVIGVAGSYTVTLDAGQTYTVASLALSDAGAVLDLRGDLQFAGSGLLTVAAGMLALSGTIGNATIAAASGTFQFDGGTLDGVTYRGTLDLSAAGSTLTATDGLTLTNAAGTGAGAADIGQDSTLTVAGTTTLDSATITLAAPGAELAGQDLTLGANLLVQDVAVPPDDVTPSGAISADTLVNDGTILADTSGASLVVSATTFTNTGLLSVSNGDLLSVQVTDGTNLVDGKLTGGTYYVGAGSTLQVMGSAAITDLNAALTLSGPGSAVEEVDGASPTPLESMLTGIDTAGVLRLLASRGYTTANNIADNGLLVLNGGTFSSAGTLVIGSTGTLFGYGEVTPPVASDGLIEANGGVLQLDGALTGTGSLVVDAGATLGLLSTAAAGAVTVAGTLLAGPDLQIGGDSSSNSGLISVGNSDTLTIDSNAFRNTGSISVDEGTLVLSNLVANTGAITVTGDEMTTIGVLILSGDNTAAWGGGLITASGAFFSVSGEISTANFNSLALSDLIQAPEIDGDIINTGATLDVTGAGNFNTYAFYGTITGGVVDGDNTVFAAGTLDDVTYAGALIIGQFHHFVGGLTITDGITLTGAAGVGPGSVTVGTGTQLTIDGTTTLDNATIMLQGAGETFTGGDPFGTAELYGDALTLGPNLVLEDGQSSDPQDYAPGGVLSGDSVVNDGTIVAGAGPGGGFAITGTDFTNAGTISVTNGDTLGIQSTDFVNIVGTALTGGTYFVGAWSTMQFPVGDTIATLDATLSLSGPGSVAESGYPSSEYNTPPPPVLLEAMLTQIGTSGVLRLLDGRSYTTTDSITDNGLLVLNGGTFTSAGTLVIGSTGTLVGYGEVVPPVASDGLIEANGGVLQLDGALTGAGSLVVDDGATLDLQSAAIAGAVAVAGTLQVDDALQIGGDNSSNSGLIIVGNAATLTINSTAFRNTGSIDDEGTLLLGNLVSNTGTIGLNGDVMGNEAVLILSGDNTTPWGGGSIVANDAHVVIEGRISAANLASIVLSSVQGQPEIDGDIINTGGTFDVAGGSDFSRYAFYGTIVGGVLDGDGASFGSGTLDGVIYRGALFINDIAFADGQLTVVDGITLTGASGTGPGSVTVGSGAEFKIDGTTTLDDATITLLGAGPSFFPDGDPFIAAVLDGQDLTLGRNLIVADGRSGNQDGAPGGVLNADTLVNDGTILADAGAGGGFAITGADFTNAGTIIVTNGDTLGIVVTDFVNMVGTMLTVGDYFVGAGSTLEFPLGDTITTLDATLSLSGPGSVAESAYPPSDSSTTPSPVPLEAMLQVIGTFGVLRLLDGRGYTTTNSITDNGQIALDWGIFTSGGTLAIGSTGTLVGNGTVTPPIANAGTIEASGGLLTLSGGIAGVGTLLVDAGSKLSLTANAEAAAIIDYGTLTLDYVIATSATFTVASAASIVGLGTIGSTVANAGTIEARGGLLRLEGGVTGAGALLVDASSKLDLAGFASAATLTDDGAILLDGNTITLTAAMLSATGSVQGPGRFLGAITDDGVIDARGGLLAVGPVSGTGSLRIEAGSTLDLTAAASAGVTFAGGGAGTLQLDVQALFSGAIGGLALQDSLVFANEVVTSATVNGSTLTVAGSAGTVGYQVAGALSGNHFAVGPDGHIITLAPGHA